MHKRTTHLSTQAIPQSQHKTTQGIPTVTVGTPCAIQKKRN